MLILNTHSHHYRGHLSNWDWQTQFIRDLAMFKPLSLFANQDTAKNYVTIDSNEDNYCHGDGGGHYWKIVYSISSNSYTDA
jgi:hypothetical protein